MTLAPWITFLLGAQAMVGQDPARFRRSTTATRFPCEASDQAKNLALPLPSTTTSYSSGCDTLFPLRVNSSRSCHASAATISIPARANETLGPSPYESVGGCRRQRLHDEAANPARGAR